MPKPIAFVFFGSSSFSTYVLKALELKGFVPTLSITSTKESPSFEQLKAVNADVFIVASFGKILPNEIIYMPPHKTLNVHPSLLPKLRGPSPIQGAIVGEKETGVTIMRLNEKMDEGPIVAQKKVHFEAWPIKYSEAEKILGTEGGLLLADILEQWIARQIVEKLQDDTLATYTKMIKKEDADITSDSPELAFRKILAYEVWPRARLGDLIITEAHLDNGNLVLDRVLPPGKKEMIYKDYLRGRLS